MPFQSEKQRRYLHANHPEIAKRWEQEYAGGGLARLRQAYPTNLTVGEEMQSIGTPLENQMAFVPDSKKDILLDTMYEGLDTYKDIPAYRQLREEDVEGFNEGKWDLSLPKDQYKGIEGYTAESPIIMRDFAYDTNQGGIDTIDINEMADVYSPMNDYGQFLRNQPTDERTALTGLQEKGSGIVDFLMDKGTGLRQGLSLANENYFMPALAGIGTIANRYNPLKEGSQNYNPDLQGQVDILDEWGMLGDQSSPYKITSGPLAGKNLVSGFGTNDYRKMLQKRIDYFRNKKSLTESQNEKMHEAIAEEKRILEKKTRAAAAAAASQRRAGRGGDHMSRSRDQGGLGISRSQAQAVSDANRDAGMSGWGL